jgi:two-component system, OmpR family, sensor kinase
VVVRDGDGRPALVHGIMVDITELKEAEQALRTAFEREREATRQLQRVDEMKSTFLRAASHELRTPITISRGHLEVLGPTPAPREIAETVDVVVAELGRMGRIVEDITTLVQADDPAFLRPEPVVLDAFLAELAAKARPLLGDRLQVDAVPRGVVVNADPDRMTQALLNLLHNSAVHARPGGPVRLSAFESLAGWRFQVEDSGGGLPSGQEERLFQPLQRGPSAVKGSGLGLAIVRRIGEAHGGSAGADNRPGEGVTFWITVPR